jgi:hypothetical protein
VLCRSILTLVDSLFVLEYGDSTIEAAEVKVYTDPTDYHADPSSVLLRCGTEVNGVLDWD